METKKNPLSPHLQIYRWHISSLLSITHRIVGVINILAITLICLGIIYINLREANKNKFGINTSFFLIFYGFFRFFLEFLREPDSHMGLLLNYFTMGQFLCAPMIIFGFIIYIGLKKNDKK